MTDLDQAMKGFLQHCQYEKNLSTKTLYFYRIDLNQFAAFITQNKYPLQVDLISKVAIKHYLQELSCWKVKTIKRKVATLKAMFNYLEFEDMIAANPMRRLKIRLKESLVLPKALNKSEAIAIVQEMYDSIAEVPVTSFAYLERVRDTLVIELLFSSGARVSEIAHLRREDIDLQSGTILIRGKGDKERIVQLCNSDITLLLKTYMRLFEDRIHRSGGYLLVNRRNHRLSDQSIRNMVHAVSTKVKIGKKVTPHVFRHTFATLLLENDVDIKYIQSLLGHSSIVTTQIYTQVNTEKQRQILKTKHPRRDFSMVIRGE